MLKDLILSITTPFGTIRAGNKSPSPLKQCPTILKGEDNLGSIEVREKYLSLTRKPRNNSDSKRARRSKSNSLPDTMENALEIKKVVQNSAVLISKSYPINILVVGARNVGKSALTVRFITRRYIGEYMSGENQTYQFIPDEKRQQPIIFLDESNNLEGDSFMESQLSQQNLEWADGVMLVYDVGDYKTFNYAKKMIHFITNKSNAESEMTGQNDAENTLNLPKNSNEFWKTKTASDFKPILLIGNKTDIVKRRSVSENDVRQAAQEFPPWVSCDQVSAAEDYDEVVKCVNELISKIREKRRHFGRISSKQNIKNIVGNVFRSRSTKSTFGTL